MRDWIDQIYRNCYSRVSNYIRQLRFSMQLAFNNWQTKELEPGMKIHECSCSFVFAVFNNFNETRVRVRSRSKFHEKLMFVFVRVRQFRKKSCSCSCSPVFALYVFVFFHPCLKARVRYSMITKVADTYNNRPLCINPRIFSGQHRPFSTRLCKTP